MGKIRAQELHQSVINTINSKASVLEISCVIGDWAPTNDEMFILTIKVPETTRQIMQLVDDNDVSYFIATDKIDNITYDIYSDEPIKGFVRVLV